MPLRPLLYWKKWLMSGATLAYLWVVFTTNLEIPIPRIPLSSELPTPVIATGNALNTYLASAYWQLNHIGTLLGIRYQWVMFTPRHLLNQHVTLFGVSTQGQETLLPLPHQTKRTTWQRNVIDLHEDKFHFNLLHQTRNKATKRAYAQYLCRIYSTPGDPLKAIVIRYTHKPLPIPDALQPAIEEEQENYPCPTLLAT
jgi:hypothetical protein